MDTAARARHAHRLSFALPLQAHKMIVATWESQVVGWVPLHADVHLRD